ncbi:MAG: helix-turn-helix domain-containing protein [Chloroflexota bacterium]
MSTTERRMRTPSSRGPRHVNPAEHPASDPTRGGEVTVAEVVHVLMPGARVVGGAAGSGNRVNWATTLRPRPPAFEPRGGGELVLAPRGALDSLRQSDVALTVPRILEGLQVAGAVGLVIPAPASPEDASVADRLGLPLVEVPASLALAEIDREVISLVLDRRSEMQARASALYRELAGLSVEGGGIDGILARAAGLTGHGAAFEDERFSVRAMADPKREVAILPDPASPVAATLTSLEERGQLLAWVRSQPANGTTPPAMTMRAARWNLHRVVAPVYTGDRLRGVVSLCGALDSLVDFDQLAASRLAAVCAVELSKEDAVLAAEQRVQGDLMDDILRAGSDLDQVARPAMRAGLSPSGTFGVVVVGIEAELPLATVAEVASAIQRLVRDRGSPALCRAGEAEVVVVCEVAAGTHGIGGVAHDPSELDRSLRSIAKAIADLAATRLAGTATGAGVSRPHTPLGTLPEAIREAREAWRIGRRVNGPGTLTAYGDLRIDRVLYALRDAPELRQFCDQSLGTLVEYDRRSGQNLVATLEAFFACHGNLSQAAIRLQLHRNSLLYRISRIEEVGGIDLEDPDTRLALQVALKARRLLAPS